MKKERLMTIFNVYLRISGAILFAVAAWIVFDSYIGLGAIPYKNGVACEAPLFGDIDAFYARKGYESVDWFIKNGVEECRRDIYIFGFILMHLLVFFCWDVFSILRGRRGRQADDSV